MSERVSQPEEAWAQEHTFLEARGGLQGFTLLTINAMQEQPLGRRLIDGLRAGYEAKYIRFPDDDHDEAIVFAAGFVTGYNFLIKQAETMPGAQIDMRTKVGALGDIMTLLKDSFDEYESTENSADTPHEKLQALAASGMPRFEGLSEFLQREIDGLHVILLNDYHTGELETVTVGLKEREVYSVGFSAGAGCVYTIRTRAGISNTHQQDQLDSQHKAQIKKSLEMISDQSDDEFDNALDALMKGEFEE